MTVPIVAGVVTLPLEIVKASGGTAMLEARLTQSRKDADDISMFQVTAAGDYVVPRHHEATNAILASTPSRSAKLCGGGTFFWAGKLRDGQVDGAARVLVELRTSRGCIVVGDTGSGKTVLALYLIAEMNPKSALVMVDQINLIDQWIQRAQEFLPGAKIDVLAADDAVRRLAKKYDLRGDGRGHLIFATPQSVYASTRYTVDQPLVVPMLLCDEAHVYSAPTFCAAISKIRFSVGAGLTATPDRKDGAEVVFHAYLGTTQVVFEGEVMVPDVHVVPAPHGDIQTDDWVTSYCGKLHRQITPQDCDVCEYSVQFPTCGRLKLTARGEVAWGPVNFGGMVSAWTAHPDYMTWAQAGIDRLMSKGRTVFYFTTEVAVLVRLYTWALGAYGDERVGLIVGRQNCPKEYRGQLDSAPDKQLTFCTYRKGAKGLDVAAKDALILGSPVSDVRQVAGRVRRTGKGKKTPVIILPVPHIDTLRYMAKKVANQCRQRNWPILDPHNLIPR